MANQGGTHEQHVKAGKQSHKNSGGAKSASSATSSEAKGGKQGGSKDQQKMAREQSHKGKH